MPVSIVTHNDRLLQHISQMLLALWRPLAYLDLKEGRAKCGPAADVLQESYLCFFRGTNLVCECVCVSVL